jgi:hypothetical protein
MDIVGKAHQQIVGIAGGNPPAVQCAYRPRKFVWPEVQRHWKWTQSAAQQAKPWIAADKPETVSELVLKLD